MDEMAIEGRERILLFLYSNAQKIILLKLKKNTWNTFIGIYWFVSLQIFLTYRNVLCKLRTDNSYKNSEIKQSNSQRIEKIEDPDLKIYIWNKSTLVCFLKIFNYTFNVSKLIKIIWY